MRLFSLAQLALLGAAISLASCNKHDEIPGSTATAQTGGDANAPDPLTDGSAPPSSTNPYKRYGLERAHIKYEVSGFRRGTEELYFDNWGRKEARHINVEDLTEKGITPVKTIIVTNGSHMKIANLVGQRGAFMTEKIVDSMLRLTKVDPPEVISDSVMSRMGYKRKGQASILDKTADVWFEESSGTTLHTWRGVVLKQEVNNPSHRRTTMAVSIDTSSPIPDSIFVAPKLEYIPMPERPPGR